MDNISIQELEKEFLGTGEVEGYKFVQVANSNNGYIYAVFDSNNRHFEVFYRKSAPICLDFEKRLYSDTERREMYPKSKDFGIWAWTYYGIDKASKKLNEISK